MKHPARRARDWWRVSRLFAYLLSRPQDIVPYLRFGAFTRRSPLELGMPWWSFGAVRVVEEKLQTQMDAFEYGSGGSSIFLGSRVRTLLCVEDDEKWVSEVRHAAERSKLTNVHVLHCPYDFWKTSAFAESSYLRTLSDTKYDVIVVDGAEWSEQVRDLCFWHAEQFIKPGGFIVLDDSWRYPQIKDKNKARQWREYKGCGYCRVGITATSIFDY